MKSSTNSLIIVEDNPADTTLYLRLLETVNHGFNDIRCVATLQDASAQIIKEPPGCCLLDYHLPDGSALSFLENSRTREDRTPCPMIIITGQEDTETAVKIMQHGAQDYLVKTSLDGDKLLRSIQHSVRTWQLQQQLNQLALYDPLTGLANRALFIDRLTQVFDEAKRYQRHFALFYVDLDRFKLVNDTYGHEAGDYMLKILAKCFQHALRGTDTVARLGGDEFAVILPEISEEKAHHVAYKLVRHLTMDIPWKKSYITVSPSIGVATYPSSAKTYQDLMRESDFALYRAKKNGRGQYAAYSNAVNSKAVSLAHLMAALPKALLNNELQVAYQPIFDINTYEAKGVEALVRWKFQERWIPPSQIIDFVIELGICEQFHHWLFETTLTQFNKWKENQPELELSINLMANLCHDAKIVSHIFPLIEQFSIKPEQIILEVTETHLMKYPEETRHQLYRLAKQGVRMSIDDFGTGYSSMAYLATLPCHSLKIDQKFFLDLEKNERNGQIIEAIAALAHRLGLSVVAEGIETEILLKAAKNFGCDYVQGYYLGSPVFGADNFSDFCRTSKEQGRHLMTSSVH